MSLKESVMVVNLSISQWTARKYDAKVSREVEDQHNAKNAGRFNKMLIAAEDLKIISKVAGSIRTYHYFNTLPWGDNGDRILPAANYFNYIGEMGKMKNDFERLVSEFLRQYPDLKLDAELRLGTMFNEADYPPVDKVAQKFGVTFSFMPVPDSDDLRIAISEDEVARIKADISGQLLNRVDNACADMLGRIREAVSHMAATLAEPDKIFRDSLVGNVCQLIETIPLLNFNNDAHINDVVKMIEPLCCNPEDLRTKTDLRKEIAEKAQKVLAHI